MTRFVQLSIICWLTVIVSASNIGNDRQDINLSNDGGYTDILIAISERVPENPAILERLQEYFSQASTVLFNSTRRMMYFKNITIVVPPNWNKDPTWREANDEEIFRRARVVVAEPNLAYGNIPYTLQPGGCGEEGDYIHFTPEYLTLNLTGGLPYTPAKTIVKEFSHLKWGLFDETIPVSDTTTSRFYAVDNNVHVVGCVEEVTYALNACIGSSIDGVLLPPPCDFIAVDVTGTASMLSFEYLDQVSEFCSNEQDGNPTHNKKPINLQNKLCDERSAWEVMNSLPDFRFSTSMYRADVVSLDPEIRIVHKPAKMAAATTTSSPITAATSTIATATTTAPSVQIECQQDIVCLCLDVSGSMRINNRIGIMSESVKIYIRTYLRDNAAVGIVAFSGIASLHADMTEITSIAVRDDLTSRVPTRAGGGTDIGVGLLECQRILRRYAGDNVHSTRIVLLSDGAGSLGNSISTINDDGITIDTILYEQGGSLVNRAKETGGQEILASDVHGVAELNQFLTESASRGCEAKDSAALLNNDVITIQFGDRSYTNRTDFDVTIGKDTKMVFKYSHDVDVSISSEQNLTVTIDKDRSLGIIVVTIAEVVRGYVEYTITTPVYYRTDVTVLVTVTSSPIPGVEPIDISNRFNSYDIQFSADTQLIAYLGVYQGFTPVLQLIVKVIIEQPNGVLVEMPCYDDGTGKDSVPNDGVYTGTVPAHKIDGSSRGTYFGLTIDISGEGVLPGQQGLGSRRKRCVDCNSLGKITRSATGGVIVINNWRQVEDTTPPGKITDLRVLNAAKDNVFTLGWTAPGDDLNVGTVSGYEFAVGSNVSIQSQVSLPTKTILSDVSGYLIKAGGSLQIQINTSEITPGILGLAQSANISTYYFRMRTFDAKNNFANWSNSASATIVDPVYLNALFTTTTTTTTTISTTTVTSESTTTAAVTTTPTTTSTTTAAMTTTPTTTSTTTAAVTTTPTTTSTTTAAMTTTPTTTSTTTAAMTTTPTTTSTTTAAMTTTPTTTSTTTAAMTTTPTTTSTTTAAMTTTPTTTSTTTAAMTTTPTTTSTTTAAMTTTPTTTSTTTAAVTTTSTTTSIGIAEVIPNKASPGNGGKPIFIATLGVVGFLTLAVAVGLIIVLRRQNAVRSITFGQRSKQDVEGVINNAYV